jgi:pSer/pThr/pTyr-binding forkhead associated (FHA) protein
VSDRHGAPRPLTARELQQVIHAERAGMPFLLCRDADGAPLLSTLGSEAGFTVGRGSGNDLVIDWDPQVSRLHAELRRVADEWTVEDRELSRNGTFLNGERLRGSVRLRDGDVLKVGRTAITFRSPTDAASAMTTMTGSGLDDAHVSEAQHRVLVALCRPLLDRANPGSTPATNQEIATGLYLSVDAVKGHLRTLYQRFELADLPQNQKRMELAQRAIRSGIATERTRV